MQVLRSTAAHCNCHKRALASNGNPTTDPAKGIAGTMLPLGGAMT